MKKIIYCDEIYELIKAFPKDMAALDKRSVLIHKDLEDRKLLQATSLKLDKIINEKMSKRRIQIIELQKLENPQKEEKISLIRLHIPHIGTGSCATVALGFG